MNVKQPTTEQVDALRFFSVKHGCRWREKLSGMWMNGRDVHEKDGHLLRQVRNEFGPSWLMKFDPVKGE